MSLVIFALGWVDIIAGILIFLNLIGIGYGFYFLWIIGLIHLIKGLYSLAWGGYFAAFIDIVAGLILLLSYMSIPMYYVLGAIVGILLLIKGVQSIIPFATELISG